jgi:hypothetical protein
MLGMRRLLGSRSMTLLRLVLLAAAASSSSLLADDETTGLDIGTPAGQPEPLIVPLRRAVRNLY